MSQLVTLGTAVMFLTRLPVGRFASGDMQVLAQSVRYFPFVGLLVASIMAAALALLSIVLPLSVSVALALVIGVLATGAFHEDGLADVADGAGAFDVERKLEIMRDSRVGTYGSLALILCLILRFSVLLSLAQLSLLVAFSALVVAHAGGRWGSVYLMATVSYARPEAANKVVAEGVDANLLMQCTLCLLFVLLIPAVLVTPAVFSAIPVMWLAAVLCAAFFKSAFGGITGDCLGASNVVIEITSMVFLLAILA